MTTSTSRDEFPASAAKFDLKKSRTAPARLQRTDKQIVQMESALQLIRFQHKAYQFIISLVGRVQRGEFARAEEVRTIADGMRDPACKRTTLDVAIS